MNDLKNLKVGDFVLIRGGDFDAKCYKKPITRITAKYFEVNGALYEKTTGRQRGGNEWHCAMIYAYDPKIHDKQIEETQKLILIRYLNNYDFKNLSYTFLKELYKTLEKSKGVKNEEKN